MSHDLQFDLTSKEFRQDPYATYGEMRKEAPAYQVKTAFGPKWYITNYDDVLTILKDKRFVKDYKNAFSPERLAKIQEAQGFEFITMLTVDPPDHTRLRKLVSKAFTPRRIKDLNGRIQEITDELIDNMLAKGSADLIDDFAFPLPIRVISELLGVPHEDSDKIRQWSNTIISLQTAENVDNMQESQMSMMAFITYIVQLCEERRQNPQDDLVTALIQAEEDGDKLNQMELSSMIFLLIVAGHETTVNLIGNGVFALLQHPEQKELLQNDPSLIDTAVEEMLRYQSPVETTPDYYAAEDVEIGGQLIRKGDTVVAVLGSANRDGCPFPHEDTFDITRKDNKHVAFGHGLHYCLGAPLARAEGTIAVSTLLKRIPTLKFASDPAQFPWNPSILVRGLQNFPIIWEE